MAKPATSLYGDEMSSSSECNKLLVAAIDFGTTYSGWAFSFKHEYEADPTKIASRQWYGGQHVSLKAPTTVLVKPDGRTLESFGYEAENKYAELAEENLHGNYFYFKRFKMMLHEKLGLKRDIELEDDKGLKLPAKTVFALAIRYLKDDLKTTCANKLLHGCLDDDEIHWVLTVPAIWNDQAKAFMREAAVEAGIKSVNMSVALEPEAASLFCRLVPVQKLVKGASSSGSCISAFKPGAKYMILDAGGGTVDITIHQVKEHGRLRELHKASGGAWGGTKVDEAFKKLLTNIVGKNIFEKFQRQHTDDYLDMFREFEIKKRDITPEKQSKVTFKLPSSLRDLFEEENGEDIKVALAQKTGEMSMTGDKLRIQPNVAKQLFSDAITSIVKHIKHLLCEPAVQGTEAILMVGGFSESKMLQEAIKDNFGNLKLVIPEEAGLVVLKGAVVFGHNPSAIGERVCKYTYGFEANGSFDPSKHDLDKKVEIEGRVYCKLTFDKHVELGQTVKYGESQAKRTYVPIYDDQSVICLPLYASTNASPMYVTDFGCTRIGSISVNIKDKSVPVPERGVQVDLTFSGTEIEVRAIEMRTGLVTNATMNFLG